MGPPREVDRRLARLRRFGQTDCEGRVACRMAEEESNGEDNRHLAQLNRNRTIAGAKSDVRYECWDQ